MIKMGSGLKIAKTFSFLFRDFSRASQVLQRSRSRISNIACILSYWCSVDYTDNYANVRAPKSAYDASSTSTSRDRALIHSIIKFAQVTAKNLRNVGLHINQAPPSQLNPSFAMTDSSSMVRFSPPAI